MGTWRSRPGIGCACSGTFAFLGNKLLPFRCENTPFGADRKIRYQLTDPFLKDGAFLSAIFTLNTRRGQVVRVSLERSCLCRHGTIGRVQLN